MTQSSHPKRVVVIGGGLAGLASAIELQGQGAAVTIIEANDHLGGKMNVLNENGYTFDMGPTILTLPEVLCGIIRRTGNKVQDLIDLVPLNPQWRCHFEDGITLDLHQNVDDMAEYLETQLPYTDAASASSAHSLRPPSPTPAVPCAAPHSASPQKALLTITPGSACASGRKRSDSSKKIEPKMRLASAAPPVIVCMLSAASVAGRAATRDHAM